MKDEILRISGNLNDNTSLLEKLLDKSVIIDFKSIKEDGLPDEETEYLVSDGEDITSSYFENGKWGSSMHTTSESEDGEDLEFDFIPTHWAETPYPIKLK